MGTTSLGTLESAIWEMTMYVLEGCKEFKFMSIIVASIDLLGDDDDNDDDDDDDDDE